MPRVGARRALIALIAAGIPCSGALVARAMILAQAEHALKAAGLSWSAQETRLLGARWIGLEREGVVMDEVALSLALPPRVMVSGVEVELDRLLHRAPGDGGGGSGGGAPGWLKVEVDSLELRWEERVLASGLSGALWPTLDLEGEGLSLRREGAAWVGLADQSLDLPHLRGAAHVSARWEDGLRFELSVPDAVIQHPALASRALPPGALTVSGTVSRDGALSVEGAFADIPFRGSGQAEPSPLSLDLTLEVPDAPLEAFVAVFGPLIPEADRATLRGTLGAEADLKLPEGRWSVRPRASGLGADGVIPNPDGLRGGPFTWSAPAADDVIAVRTAGEGVSGWVPLSRAGRLPAAIIASEDAGFFTHPGYDLNAIQEALNAWSEGDERPRGGSTLTQQLAKNLFTDGERTLCRKLRELLFAIELERRVGKARILELYLNVVELGPGIYGAGAASDLYFLKKTEGLTWKEAAFIAAILPAPRTYYQTAYKGGKLPRARMEQVIDNLVRLGKLKPAEAAAARSEVLRLVPAGSADLSP